jgi:hypothetical protein
LTLASKNGLARVAAARVRPHPGRDPRP